MPRTTNAVLLAAALLSVLPCSGCGRKARAGGGDDGSRDPALEVFRKSRDALEPLHQKKRPAKPGDWLDRFGDEEKGQTFEEYVASDPVRPDGKRKTLYILLLGDFTKERREIVDRTAEFMALYFTLPVKFADPVDEKAVPDSARRLNPYTDLPQVHAGWVLDELLKPRVPEDAVALIAFTASDLWPGEGWNFVFGEASLRRRVGVWSLHRFGDPAEGPDEFARCLLHTIKTGTHETGHMLGMLHCILWECNMNGSNHLAEAERQPLALCPECAPKLEWACKGDPVKRYEALEAFCRKHRLAKEAEFYRKSREAIAPLFPPEKK
jgi:archaemetzincin